jgi:hypothetical protein
MKRLHSWFSVALIALIAAFAACMASCDHKSGCHEYEHSIQEYVDSADLYRILDEYDNPTFTSVDDACTYLKNEKQYREQDSVFFSLTPETIQNVYTVLIRRGEHPTKMSIVNEYLENIKVYSNLPVQKVSMELKDPPTDIPNTVVVDTIIDGKTPLKTLRVKVLQESQTK